MADSEKKVKREIQKFEYLKNEKRYLLFRGYNLVKK